LKVLYHSNFFMTLCQLWSSWICGLICGEKVVACLKEHEKPVRIVGLLLGFKPCTSIQFSGTNWN
jgi:hypothetical protein